MRVTEQYVYVDAHYQDPQTGKLKEWFRIRDTDIEKRVIKPSKGMNCYVSVQRYRDATSLRDMVAGDPAKAGIKIPPKSGTAAAARDRKRRESEADELPDAQLHYHGLYFDFDASPRKNGGGEDEALARAQADARKLSNHLLTCFDLNPAHIQCFYSGKKGFHVVVRPEPFGIYPHKHLTYILQRAALQLKDELELGTLDTSVYTISRMWRIVNTRHPATKRFKIELSVHELATLTPAQIREMAQEARTEVDTEGPNPPSQIWEMAEYEDIDLHEPARDWWREFVDLYDAYRAMLKMKPRKPIVVPEGSEYPACIKDMLDNGPKEGGPNRNRVLLPMAGFLSDAEVDQEEALQLLEDWTREHYPDGNKLRERLQNAKTVVRSAYRGHLRFACRFIRANRGSGEKGLVRCPGEDKCAWIKTPKDQEPAAVPLVHLAEATNGCYIDGKVKTPVHVSALVGDPFGVPIKGKILCTPDVEERMCAMCPNMERHGAMTFEVSAERRNVLEFVNVTDLQRDAAIRRMCKIPRNCKRNTPWVDQLSNVQELEVIPMVDFDRLYTRDDEEENELGGKGSKHVQRRGFFLGHGIEANGKYLIESMVFMHPKDQRVCFLFDSLEPARDDIDKFVMTPVLKKNLEIFQPRPGQSVADKLEEIHIDLEANVHQIGGRRDLAKAIDLAYHSVIKFSLMGKEVEKGWFELLVLGDSATGKSTLMDRLMGHYGLGEMIAGEEAKRTGLVHNTTQLQKTWVLKWGKIPQNDRRLLVIDEFAGIDRDEVGKLTQLRSSGKAHGSGVTSHYETWARTRLILLTNPRDNTAELASYNYGIEGVRWLFKELQDCRRVDLAMLAEKGEVPTSMLNKRWDKVDEPHIYTSDVCQKLILWAWSRETRDVVWLESAVDQVRYWGEVLGDTYECDIPLAERADLRMKIARIGAAVAARLFSTDDKGEKLIVKPGHVDYAASMLDRSYRKPSMSYVEYARKWKSQNYLTQERRKEVIDELQSYSDPDMLITCLLNENLFTKVSLRDGLDLEDDEYKRLWRFMLRSGLTKKVARGLRKVPAFTKLLKSMKAKGSGYTDESPDQAPMGGDGFFDDVPF